jgi:hypothetical protein
MTNGYFLALAYLGLIRGSTGFAPLLHRSTIGARLRSSVFASIDEPKVDEKPQEQYTEITYEKYFDGIKVSTTGMQMHGYYKYDREHSTCCWC